MSPALRVDFCGPEAATFAVRNWHYSRCLPAGKMVAFGVWEDGRFIGCVIFSRGANNNIAKPYGLGQTECVELTRVALDRHAAPVSQICALAVRLLRRHSPGLRLLVSYADPGQGHRGGIYQAMGWFYVGSSQPQRGVILGGRAVHKRTASAAFGSIVGLRKSEILWKHKYLLPLDEDARAKIAPMAKPYPKA